MSVLENLEPKLVMRYFEEICGIPHGSGDTWKISNYLVDFAKSRNLKFIQDSLGNVIIFKDASKGYENRETIIIQGHMDMVCEKENGASIDFSKDGLDLVVDENIIYARGTTLGGDDGIAVAYALALLDSKEIEHPELEVVITVDEEVGMLGAAALDCGCLKGKTMLNIDSEEEGKLLVSCAGGVTLGIDVPVNLIDINQNSYIAEIQIKDCTGGHSGVEIDKEGANANIILGRVLYILKKKYKFNIIYVQGGLKDNAITRHSKAVVSFNDEREFISIKKEICDLEKIIQNEYKITDPDMKIDINPSDASYNKMLNDKSSKNIVDLLRLIPNGVVRMSKNIDGLVETSLNLGILNTSLNDADDYKVHLSILVRSSVESAKNDVVSRLECITEFVGGSISFSGDYPGWEYKSNSRLRNIMSDEYEKMYGVKPEIQAIHAGVECGLFAGKIEDLDCVSFGPQIDDIHTPSERIYIDSIKRTWEYLLQVLKNI